jgi:hypothetical protein
MAGPRSDADEGAALWSLDEPAERMLAALRLICGGSVVTTRSIHAQADCEFQFLHSGSALLTGFAGADKDRPTILSTDAIEQFRATYTALAQSVVIADRSLQVAVRRLIHCGARSVDGTDTQIELKIECEL